MRQRGVRASIGQRTGCTRWPGSTKRKHPSTATRPARDVVDRGWLERDFVPLVQRHGAAVIEARGASSAFSAAQAIVDHVRSLRESTAGDDWFSATVPSDGNPYGLPSRLIASFPLRSRRGGDYAIQKDAVLDEAARERVRGSFRELEEEREIVRDLIP